MKNKSVKRLVIGIFLALLVVGGYILLSLRILQKANLGEESLILVKPSSKYIVTSISENEVVLEGEEGLLTLPREKLEVWNGDPSNATLASIDFLALGTNVRVELIPGQKAWIYVIQ